MSSVVISGDTSGAITLAAPAVSGTNTATLPAATGTVMVSGNMPAFSATSTTLTTVTTATFTKIAFQSEEFDTNSYYDNATNYRFTPLIAGYYQVSGNVNTAAATGTALTTIYKNGSRFKDGNSIISGGESQVSALVYLNGSTDYVELWYYQSSGISQTTQVNVWNAYFQAAMIRSS